MQKLRVVLSCFALWALLVGITGKAFAIETHVRVAFCTEYPPYQFCDNSGMPSGLHIDLLNEIGAAKHLSIDYFPFSTDSECLTALNEGRADAVLGFISDHASDYLTQCSDEISSSNLSLFAPDGISNALRRGASFNSLIAVAQYGVGNSTVMMNLGARQRISVSSPLRIFQTQRAGIADVMVGDRNSLQYQIAQAGLEDKYVIYSNYVGTVRYNILVSKGETALLRMLNEGLAQLRASGRYDELNIKWIYDSEGYQVRQTVRKILYISAVVFVIVSIYIISETRVRRLLKQEVKAKTQALRASNEELAQRIRQIETEGELRDLLVQNSPSSLILFDESGRVVLVNSSTLRLLGLDALPEQADVTDFPIFKELLQHQSDAGENNTPLKYTLCQPGAEKRTFRYNVHLLTARGQNGRRLLSIDDVTAEEEQKQALFEREKSLALSRMVAGIAHEIRNPLMSIRTFAWMAKTKLSDPQFLDAFSEFVPTEVDRINKLIESLINYARPTRGGQRTIILRDLVEESLYLVRAAAPGGRISIQNEQVGSLSVYANPDQIKQVLINILMNSVESMEERITAGAPPPLCMRITSSAENARFVTLSVSDQGVGMSEEVLHHCTDPFFTTKTKGTGLGLALSRQYLLENGGDLTIKSVPGKGTEVTLFIPAAPAASTDVHTDREVIL